MGAEEFVTEITQANIAFAQDMANQAESKVARAIAVADEVATVGALGGSGGLINPNDGPEPPFPDPFPSFGIVNVPVFSADFQLPDGRPTGIEPPLAEPYSPNLADIPDVDTSDFITSDLFDDPLPGPFGGKLPTQGPSGIDTALDFSGVRDLDIRDISPPPAPAEIIIPPDPDISLPSFTATIGDAPTLDEDLVALFNNTYDSKLPAMYASVQSNADIFLNLYYPGHKARLAELEDRVAADLQGGTGYSETVRDAILDRTRAEVKKGLISTDQAAFEQAAKRGMLFPDGAALDTILVAEQEALDQLAKAELDITRIVADQEQKNAQFALEQEMRLRLSIRDGAIQYTNTLIQINGQALQYAQQVVQAIIDAFNARVVAFNADVEGFRAKVSLFETEARVAFLEIEKFKALIDVELAKITIDTNLVERYKTQVQAELARIELFKADIERVRLELTRRELLIQSFRAEVEVFQGLLSLKNNEYTAWQVLNQNDRALLEARIQERRSIETEIRAVQAKNEAEIAKQSGDIARNEALIKEYEADLRSYGFLVEQEKTNFDAEQTSFDKRFEVISERIRQLAEEKRLELQMLQTQADLLAKEEELKLNRAVESARLFNESINRSTDAAVAAAQTFAQIGAAAMNASATMSSVAFEEQQEL